MNISHIQNSPAGKLIFPIHLVFHPREKNAPPRRNCRKFLILYLNPILGQGVPIKNPFTRFLETNYLMYNILFKRE